MRPRSTPAALLAVIALGVVAAAPAAGASGTAAARAWTEDITAPVQFDLTLAEISFRAPRHSARGRGPIGNLTLALRAAGPTGLDYLAGALTRFSVRGRPRALVLIVNRRPRGSLAPDLARIDLTVTAPRRIGAPVLMQVSDPLTHAVASLTPALCDLPIRGRSLTARDLKAVLSRGSRLRTPAAGGEVAFDDAAAVAQAYDLVCRRPYDQAFRQAVAPESANCEPSLKSVVPCCPSNAMCAPTPCPPCPCGPGPCRAQLGWRGRAAILCPLRTPLIACPL